MKSKRIFFVNMFHLRVMLYEFKFQIYTVKIYYLLRGKYYLVTYQYDTFKSKKEIC